MPRYAEMSKAELEAELAEVRARYGEMAARGLKLNMARGKPSAAQLELSLPLLDVLDSDADLAAEDGTDCRNYGVLDGIPEAKRLMAALLDDEPENVIVLGNASLTAMYDAMVRYLVFGALGSTPWGRSARGEMALPRPRLRPSLLYLRRSRHRDDSRPPLRGRPRYGRSGAPRRRRRRHQGHLVRAEVLEPLRHHLLR